MWRDGRTSGAKIQVLEMLDGIVEKLQQVNR
jgi:hypothetical protein